MFGQAGAFRCAKSAGAMGVCILSALLICSSASGAPGSLDLEFSLRSTYDDNILSYSDADLDLISDPAAPLNKFGITSKDDFIFMPEIGLVYKSRLARHTVHLGLVAAYNYYKDNDIKRYARFGAMARRYIRRGMYFQVDLIFIPDYYYRNTFSDTAGYQQAKYDKMSGRAKFSFSPLKNVITNLTYEYSNKNFVPLFDERDIKTHEFKIETSYRPARRWKGWGSYAYVTAVAAGADNPIFLRDTSYDSFVFTYGSRFYFKGLGRKSLQFAGVISYSIVYFQTSKLTDEDRYRIGRKDKRWQFNLTIEQNLSKHLDLGLGFQRRSKSVDLPARDLIPYLEYSSDQAYFNLNFIY
jgi:hypothetical protein